MSLPVTDRELLELAAKAIKHTVLSPSHSMDGAWIFPKAATPNDDGEYPAFLWSPLRDDGDALRLAVELNLGIIFDYYPVFRSNDLIGKSFRARIWCIAGWVKEEFDSEDAKANAVRRCIVRAAAEIGRAMR